MCGITGFYSFSENNCKAKYLIDAKNALSHRGPDDDGIVFFERNNNHIESTIINNNFRGLDNIGIVGLGHTRLSIIDLSLQGHQPFFSICKRYCLVYNGEIFNFKELRSELEKIGYNFRTNSDTEVVLNAIIEWSYSAFAKFNGMWAIAFYDIDNNNLLLSRDHFGIKPLYYYYDNFNIFFSSDINSLLKFPFKNTPDIKTLSDYYNFDKVDASSNTFYSRINQLEPGSYIQIFNNNNSFKVSKFYDVQISIKENTSSIDLVDEFDFLLTDSLNLRIRSDVPVGAFLSGGLDSNLIVSLLKEKNMIDDSFKTYSAVFNELKFTEDKFIDKTIKKYNLNSSKILITHEDVIKDLDELIIKMNEPFRSLAVYSQFHLYKSIHQNNGPKVILNGQGADEMLAGYREYFQPFLISNFKEGDYSTFINELYFVVKNKDLPALSIIKNIILSLFRNKESFNLNTILKNSVTKNPLREYLKYDDLTSMSFGIESRPPFLDPRLVNFAFSINPKFKIKNGYSKYIERICSNKYVDKDIVYRKDKVGFVSPQETWQQTSLKDIFDLEFSSINQILKNTENFPNLLNYSNDRNSNWHKRWKIFNMNKWLKNNNF